VAQRLPARQGHAFGGLELALGNGVDACADDFAGVGRDVDDQRNGGGGKGAQLQAHGGQAEVDDEDLDQQRCVADQFDIGTGQVCQPFLAAGLGQCTEDTDQKTEHRGAQGQGQGGPGAGQEIGPVGQRHTEIK